MLTFRPLRKQSLSLVAFFLIACCHLRGEGALLRHTFTQVWNTSSGLPQDTVHQLLETHDGFLWLATEGGLVRFDGFDFTVYDKHSTPGSFTSDLVNGLFEDAAGHLWIATSDGLLVQTGSSFRRYTLQDGLPSASVWAVAQDHLGLIWIATSGGLARLEGGKFVAHSISGNFDGRMQQPFSLGADGTLWIASNAGLTRVDPSGKVSSRALPSPPVSLAVSPDMSLWIATTHSLLRVDRSGTLTSPSPPPGIGQAKLQSLAWDHANALWAGTTAGLYTSQSPAWMHPAWRRFGRADGLPGEDVSRVSVGLDGALSIVADAGVAAYQGGRFSTVSEQAGFRGADVLSLYRDREGDLWLGSANAGAAILRHLPFATVGAREGLPADPVRSLFAGNAGVWMGTSAGLSHLLDGFSTVTTAQGLASDEILALAPGAAPETLWVGTPDGLSYLDHGHATTLTASDGLPDDSIRSLLLAHDQILWIGTSHGLASLPAGDAKAALKAASIHTYTQADGLGSNVIGALLEDADGSLWIGTLAGLGHLAHGQIRNYGAKDGLTSGIVTTLAKHGDTLWIGTSGGGLFAYRSGRISAVGMPADLNSGRMPSTLYAIVVDNSDHVWLSSSTGIYRVPGSDLDALGQGRRTAGTLRMDHFDVSDGLRLQDCTSGGHPEAALGTDGLLWFATQKGASVVDTRGLLDRAAPPVHLEDITVDDALVTTGPDGAILHIPAGHARLAFHYAGISLATPAKVRYRYQLEHFDREWIDAGTRRTAYYTNIPAGRYTFRVLASVNGSPWSSTSASITFTIAPHYYQTWWFYTLLAIALGLIGWQLYLYRLRQVELRFDAVLAERGRIAREIHDTLAQDIVGISVQLELVSRLMTMSVEKAMAQLKETRALVRRSLEQARSSIWDLRSSSTGDLPTRLRDAGQQITRDSGITLRLKIGGTYRGFPQATEDELLRIAQEAITNAVRHASPTKIEVTLNYHAAGARLEVQDDGKGFAVSEDKSGPTGHFGIRGMHERAQRARATLEIRSAPGAGTTVVAEAPQG